MSIVLKQNTHQPNEKRLIGLDVLKCLSMFFIVIHHVSKHGGFFANSTGTNKIILEILNALFLPSVNIFVYISAYLIIQKGKTNIRKYINLYAQIVFFSLFTFFICCIFKLYKVSFSDFFKCFLPISFNLFWFCREYLLLYIIAPLLLKIVQTLNKKEYVITISLIFAILLYSNIFNILILPIESGFSFIWFIILFLLAGYQYKFGFGVKKYIHIIVYTASSLLSVFIIKLNALTIDYSNVITVLQTISLFNILYNININNKHITNIISYIATCTLGIYLLHDGYFIQPVLYTKIFKTYNHFNNNLLLHFFAFVFIIFFAGLIVESIRKLIIKCFKYIIYKCKSKNNNNPTSDDNINC